MASVEIDKYMDDLRQFAEGVGKKDNMGSPEYYKKVLKRIQGGNNYLQAVYEELLGQYELSES